MKQELLKFFFEYLFLALSVEGTLKPIHPQNLFMKKSSFYIKQLFLAFSLLTLFTSCASFQYKRGEAVYLGDESGIRDTVYFQAKLPFGMYQVYNSTDLESAKIDVYVVRSKWVIPTELNAFDKREVNFQTSLKQ